MHQEILTKEQLELFPLLKKAGKKYGLVGGTAVALQIGHRRSLDFDLFSHRAFKNALLRQKIKSVVKIDRILVNKNGEFTFLANNTKVTFFNYPFALDYRENFDKIIKMPDLLTLAAMKAYALGQRAKWKDYVDLYFIMKRYHGMDKIVRRAKTIFQQEFNEKIFRTQLAYFTDIDYSEEVVFMPGHEVADNKIKKELIQFSLEK
ncbi:MAG: hypothetical protein A3H70_04965 [Candidatus Komeilibacteria bacterium RIFCSPLOWO2_02_FULL_48_11]|uniref:Nucleotidyl transferase AbiEii toxin, Type IV TA system n=1 Tax=Candidatus Komeilibacteria bacterium RIFCSPLOWO2_02_FULL_48_11 TaxID=1798553 RepID=A0A1G2BUD4_9BACT|nr:MAG: hypothetical protein A3H70_04965 [Candidatus Komeilibacteria bacterium RIFCSPLOWO2_02_FULL_48_11]